MWGSRQRQKALLLLEKVKGMFKELDTSVSWDLETTSDQPEFCCALVFALLSKID